MIDIGNIQASSITQGFSNYGNVTSLSLSMTPGTVAAGGNYTQTTSVNLTNTSITHILIQPNFKNALWYQSSTYLAQADPSWAATNYELDINNYYVGNEFFLRARLYNLTGVAHAFSSFTINCELNLYKTPLQAQS